MTNRFFIARHGETVFNASGRMQGDAPHTPLTRAGFAQADAMGAALRDALRAAPRLQLWSSPTGRALQTLAIVTEHLELDWHQVRTDARLREIDVGAWGGRLYSEVRAEVGEAVTHDQLFLKANGESYIEVAMRLAEWLGELDGSADRLILMHGMSSRVLRALLLGLDPHPELHAPIAPGLPQGSVSMIADGFEQVLHLGMGYGASA